MDVRELDVRCAVCGALSRHVEVAAWPSFGMPDLDLRPHGAAREALAFKVQRCAVCGYCAPSLGVAPPGAADTVASAVYIDVDQRAKMPRLARSFFCAALIDAAAGRTLDAGKRFVEASWACDSVDAVEQARICRERAAESLTTALANGDIDAPRAVLQALVADLWRRARRWDEALDACDAVDTLLAGEDDEWCGDGAGAVATLIRELVEAGDDDVHNAAEAFASDE